MEGQEAKDIGDSLRLEVGATPHLEMVVRSMVNDHVQLIESNFGEFIPEKSKQRARIAAYNTIITRDIVDVKDLWIGAGRDVLGELRGITSYDILVSLKDRLNTKGYNLPDGGVTVNLIKSPEQEWEEVSEQTKSTIEATIKERGYDISPKEYIFGLLMFYTSGHELVHAYVDPNLPHYVNEFFAYAMQNFMLEKELGAKFSGDKLNDLYQAMVVKYGDDFYKTMFGAMRNPITRFRIFGDLSREKVRAALPMRHDI